ncbi:MAG: hypothetical protein ACM3ZR_03890 [Pseudomonadota bacterium]
MPDNNIVSFNSILVNTISRNSGIFAGTNSQDDWSSNSNEKSGFGNIIGTSNAVSHGVHIFMDNDLIDTPIMARGYKPYKQPAAEKKSNIRIYLCRKQKKHRH